MKIVLKQPLDLIKKKGLTEFYLEAHAGTYVLRATDFKQMIKQSEYEVIMENAVNLEEPKAEQSRPRAGRPSKTQEIKDNETKVKVEEEL